MRIPFLALIVFALTGLQAVAGDRLALVIGNSAYGKFGNLANSANDARLMAGTLEQAGFEVSLLTDARQDQMKRAIADFGRALRAAGPEAAGLFYFAGHGVQSRGQNFLIPITADLRDEADLDLLAVEANWVLRQMESAGNATNIVILDACRNNPFARSFRSAERGLARMSAPTGSFIAYATAPGDVAYDGEGRNSPYTTALARNMLTPNLAIEQLFKRVRVDVLRETGELQTPWDSSSLIGDFYFVSDGARPPAQSTVPAVQYEQPQIAALPPQPQPAQPQAGRSKAGDSVKLRITTDWSIPKFGCVDPGALGNLTVPLGPGAEPVRTGRTHGDGNLAYAVTAERDGEGLRVFVTPDLDGSESRTLEIELDSAAPGSSARGFSTTRIPGWSRCGGIQTYVSVLE